MKRQGHRYLSDLGYVAKSLLNAEPAPHRASDASHSGSADSASAEPPNHRSLSVSRAQPPPCSGRGRQRSPPPTRLSSTERTAPPCSAYQETWTRPLQACGRHTHSQPDVADGTPVTDRPARQPVYSCTPKAVGHSSVSHWPRVDRGEAPAWAMRSGGGFALASKRHQPPRFRQGGRPGYARPKGACPTPFRGLAGVPQPSVAWSAVRTGCMG